MRKPLMAQLTAVVIFIGLCILACFTAFYRNGTIHISSRSALLMSAFFVTFGVTLGTYLGCLLYGRRTRLLSVELPAAVSAAATLTMYLSELVLMDGLLFRFGVGWLFDPVGFISLAPIDFIVVILSGTITYAWMWVLNRKAKPSMACP